MHKGAIVAFSAETKLIFTTKTDLEDKMNQHLYLLDIQFNTKGSLNFTLIEKNAEGTLSKMKSSVILSIKYRQRPNIQLKHFVDFQTAAL